MALACTAPQNMMGDLTRIVEISKRLCICIEDSISTCLLVFLFSSFLNEYIFVSFRSRVYWKRLTIDLSVLPTGSSAKPLWVLSIHCRKMYSEKKFKRTKRGQIHANLWLFKGCKCVRYIGMVSIGLIFDYYYLFLGKDVKLNTAVVIFCIIG